MQCAAEWGSYTMLNVRYYTACMFGHNEYLDNFLGEKLSDKISGTELKKSFWTLCQMGGLSRHMGRVLIVKLLILKSLSIGLN